MLRIEIAGAPGSGRSITEVTTRAQAQFGPVSGTGAFTGGGVPAMPGCVAGHFIDAIDIPVFAVHDCEVAVDKDSGQIKVEHFTTAIDLGLPVNTDGALSQVEGGTLFGLSLAMYEQATMHNGLLDQTNFDTYTPIRMAQVPPVTIHILANGHTPVGVGEPA